MLIGALVEERVGVSVRAPVGALTRESTGVLDGEFAGAPAEGLTRVSDEGLAGTLIGVTAQVRRSTKRPVTGLQ